jgi:hypothetical protein
VGRAENAGLPRTQDRCFPAGQVSVTYWTREAPAGIARSRPDWRQRRRDRENAGEAIEPRLNCLPREDEPLSQWGD